MREKVVEWYGDEHSRIYKKQSRYLFALLAFVFYAMPELNVDQMPFVIRLEQIIGIFHPSILYVSELKGFGSKAALLLLFVNIIYPFYILYALMYAHRLGTIKENISLFKKLLVISIVIIFGILSPHIVLFYVLGKQYEYPSILDTIIENNQLIFF